MKLDRKTFKKLFPNLANELESNKHRIQINSVRTDPQASKTVVHEGFVNYDPDIIDFLQRCETKEQAEEIINYMEKRREIRHQYAQKLREQLKEKGVRSFGPQKKRDYYLKHG